jgi:TMEM175 potassium channel family protein
MAGVRDRYAALYRDEWPTERLQFFSDAVFAIAMTLLVLDIDIPDVDSSRLGNALRDAQPQLFAFVLSFAVIAATWVAHHRRFEIVRVADTRLVQLNFALLLVVTFLPFPTAVLSEYGSETPAVVLYAGTVAALGLIQLVTWSHVRKAGLLNSEIDEGTYRYGRRVHAVDPAVFLASIVVALLGFPLAAMLTWLAIPPGSWLVRRTADGGGSVS